MDIGNHTKFNGKSTTSSIEQEGRLVVRKQGNSGGSYRSTMSRIISDGRETSLGWGRKKSGGKSDFGKKRKCSDAQTKGATLKKKKLSVGRMCPNLKGELEAQEAKRNSTKHGG